MAGVVPKSTYEGQEAASIDGVAVPRRVLGSSLGGDAARGRLSRLASAHGLSARAHGGESTGDGTFGPLGDSVLERGRGRGRCRLLSLRISLDQPGRCAPSTTRAHEPVSAAPASAAPALANVVSAYAGYAGPLQLSHREQPSASYHPGLPADVARGAQPGQLGHLQRVRLRHRQSIDATTVAVASHGPAAPSSASASFASRAPRKRTRDRRINVPDAERQAHVQQWRAVAAGEGERHERADRNSTAVRQQHEHLQPRGDPFDIGDILVAALAEQARAEARVATAAQVVSAVQEWHAGRQGGSKRYDIKRDNGMIASRGCGDQIGDSNTYTCVRMCTYLYINTRSPQLSIFHIVHYFLCVLLRTRWYICTYIARPRKLFFYSRMHFIQPSQ